MPGYTCSDCPAATYFFTVRAARRGTDLFLRDIDRLRTATRKTKLRYPFDILEIVVLGDAIHTLWQLPTEDADYSNRWRMLKTAFSRGVQAPGLQDDLSLRPSEKGLWQRGLWAHAIRDMNDLAAHRQMIWSAPVQAGLVSRPELWPHSSIHRANDTRQYAPKHESTVGHLAPAPFTRDVSTQVAPQ